MHKFYYLIIGVFLFLTFSTVGVVAADSRPYCGGMAMTCFEALCGLKTNRGLPVNESFNCLDFYVKCLRDVRTPPPSFAQEYRKKMREEAAEMREANAAARDRGRLYNIREAYRKSGPEAARLEAQKR